MYVARKEAATRAETNRVSAACRCCREAVRRLRRKMEGGDERGGEKWGEEKEKEGTKQTRKASFVP